MRVRSRRRPVVYAAFKLGMMGCMLFCAGDIPNVDIRVYSLHTYSWRNNHAPTRYFACTGQKFDRPM